MSHCHKLKFSNHYIFATQCRRPSIFQTLIYVTINNLSLKFQKFNPTGCEDIGIQKIQFVAKTQFLLNQTKNIFVVQTFSWIKLEANSRVMIGQTKTDKQRFKYIQLYKGRVSKKRGIRVNRLVYNRIFKIETIFIYTYTISDSMSSTSSRSINNNCVGSNTPKPQSLFELAVKISCPGPCCLAK